MIAKDLEQSERMQYFRIKLDVWSRDCPEEVQKDTREMVVAAFLRLPSGRVWLYTKRVKHMILSHERG